MGIARYTRPEYLLGEEYVKEAYVKAPKESYQSMREHLTKMFSHATDRQICSILG